MKGIVRNFDDVIRSEIQRRQLTEILKLMLVQEAEIVATQVSVECMRKHTFFFSFTAHSKHFRDTCMCENLRGTCTRVSWSINYWILLLLNCTTAPQECTSTKTYRFDKLSFGNVPSSIEMMLLDDKYLT